MITRRGRIQANIAEVVIEFNALDKKKTKMAAAWLHQVHSNSAGSWFGILNIRTIIYLSLCTNSSHLNQKYRIRRIDELNLRRDYQFFFYHLSFKKKNMYKKNLVHNISLSLSHIIFLGLKFPLKISAWLSA